jgi:hypothetical protein
MTLLVVLCRLLWSWDTVRKSPALILTLCMIWLSGQDQEQGETIQPAAGNYQHNGTFSLVVTPL